MSEHCPGSVCPVWRWCEKTDSQASGLLRGARILHRTVDYFVGAEDFFHQAVTADAHTELAALRDPRLGVRSFAFRVEAALGVVARLGLAHAMHARAQDNATTARARIDGVASSAREVSDFVVEVVQPLVADGCLSGPRQVSTAQGSESVACGANIPPEVSACMQEVDAKTAGLIHTAGFSTSAE